MRRQHGDRHAAIDFPFAQPDRFEQLQSVHLGHVKISDDKMNPLALARQNIKRFLILPRGHLVFPIHSAIGGSFRG